jgi:thioesterase domain-containing protein
LKTVEEMAAHYLKQIRELQPHGPYYLGGFCMGGAVAYHMAQLLLEQDQEVKLLAAFDTFNHNGNLPSVSVGTRFRNLREKTFFHWANVARLGMPQRISYLREKLTEVKARKLKQWSSRGAPFLEDVNDHAGFSYRPKPYPGKLTLFQPKTNYHSLQKPSMGWNEFALGGVEVIELPAYPGGIFVEPYVRVLADKLRACIDAADQDNENRANLLEYRSKPGSPNGRTEHSRMAL